MSIFDFGICPLFDLQKIVWPAKTPLAKQGAHHQLLQLRKDLCPPWAVIQGQGEPEGSHQPRLSQRPMYIMCLWCVFLLHRSPLSGKLWSSSERCCSGKLARELAYLIFWDQIPATANCALMRHTRLLVSPHRRGTSSLGKVWMLQRVPDWPDEPWEQEAGRWVLPSRCWVGHPKEMEGTGTPLQNRVKRARLRKNFLSHELLVLCRGGCPRGGKDRCACAIGLNNAKAQKSNSYELSAPMKRVVPGLGRPVCLCNRVKLHKSW